MLESFSKQGEVSKTPLDNKKELDPDKRMDVNSDIPSDVHSDKGLDPDSRMDVQNELTDVKTDDSLDPDRRMDINAKEISPKDINRSLSSIEKNVLSTGGMSKEMVEKCKINKNDVVQLRTINETLEGKRNPETGVLYQRKKIDIGGVKMEGVFPKFDSAFTCRLDKENYQASDDKQAKDCMDKLREAIKNEPELKKNFTPRQLEQINDSKAVKISGFVWHHNEELGKMELVDADIHAKTRHTGGKSIWGGGQDNR